MRRRWSGTGNVRNRASGRSYPDPMELPVPDPSDALIVALADIESTATGWLAISQALKIRENEFKDLQAGWLMTAFDYVLARHRVHDSPRGGSAFVPSIGWDNGSYPLALPLVPDVVLELWSNVVDRSEGVGSQARLHHLLFERRNGNAGDHARAAAAAYLSIGFSDWPRIERVNCLHWSLELSRRLKDNDRADAVHAPLVTIAQESLSQKDPEPGVALHALEVLVNDVPDHALLPELLVQARAAYSTPWLAASGDLQFEVQRGRTRGQYPQLGRMLVKLKKHLDGSWHRYLWTFLVSPFGRNYRNELAHGFVEQVGVYGSALTLIAALHLALAPVQTTAPTLDETPTA